VKPYSVCILGNSHIAALYQAWKRGSLRVSDQAELTFFGAPGGWLRYLTCRDGALVPEHEELRRYFLQTSGGREEIIIGNYDAVVLYALGIEYSKILKLCSQYGTAAHLKWGPIENLVSSSCFTSVLNARLETSTCFEFLPKIRTTFAGTVLLCPTPFASRSISLQRFDPLPERFSNPAFLDALFEEYRNAVRAMTAKYNCEVVWQTEATMELPGFTKEEFGYGSPTMKEKVRDEYNKHMNEDFGALMLAELLHRLDLISGDRVLHDLRPVSKPHSRAVAAALRSAVST
jgi:hypothetical protein